MSEAKTLTYIHTYIHMPVYFLCRKREKNISCAYEYEAIFIYKYKHAYIHIVNTYSAVRTILRICVLSEEKSVVSKLKPCLLTTFPPGI